MPLLNGAGAVVVNRATYVGTVVITATAGQMAMQFHPAAAAGGTNSWLGVWNAYNRVKVFSRSQDSTTNWSYGSSTWRPADGAGTGSGLLNRVTWVDGLQQSQVLARYMNNVQTAGPISVIGVNFNSTTAVPGGFDGINNSSATTTTTSVIAEDRFIGMGVNYAQAMEASASGTVTYSGATNMQLIVDLEM